MSFERDMAHGGRLNPSRDQIRSAETVKRRMERLHEQTSEYKAMLAANRYPANFGEQRKGVEGILLPLGDAEAVERLMRDIEAFGFGMGQCPIESAEGLIWAERSKIAQEKLREHYVHIRTQHSNRGDANG